MGSFVKIDFSGHGVWDATKWVPSKTGNINEHIKTLSFPARK